MSLAMHPDAIKMSKSMYDSFDDYIDYLNKHRKRFPAAVYDFASDVNRHNLNSPHSLHDSWMTSITIKENRNPKRPFNPKPTIEIVLLGQMHDRDLILTYENVQSYLIEGIKNSFNWKDTFQGDVMCHEVTLDESGHIAHEILFASESKITIVCESFMCQENMHE